MYGKMGLFDKKPGIDKPGIVAPVSPTLPGTQTITDMVWDPVKRMMVPKKKL